MNTPLTIALFGALLVGASAYDYHGDEYVYGGYGGEFGLYGEYGSYGAYGYYDDYAPAPLDGHNDDGDDHDSTCARGKSCEFGDDVEDNEVDDIDNEDVLDEKHDDDDDDDGEPAPAPTTVSKPRSPIKPVPIPQPIGEENTPTPSVPNDTPAGGEPVVNTETTRSTPVAPPLDEGAAASFSGSSILLAFSAAAVGGALLM